jgi:hypothetical protein
MYFTSSEIYVVYNLRASYYRKGTPLLCMFYVLLRVEKGRSVT